MLQITVVPARGRVSFIKWVGRVTKRWAEVNSCPARHQTLRIREVERVSPRANDIFFAYVYSPPGTETSSSSTPGTRLLTGISRSTDRQIDKQASKQTDSHTRQAKSVSFTRERERERMCTNSMCVGCCNAAALASQLLLLLLLLPSLLLLAAAGDAAAAAAAALNALCSCLLRGAGFSVLKSLSAMRHWDAKRIKASPALISLAINASCFSSIFHRHHRHHHHYHH